MTNIILLAHKGKKVKLQINRSMSVIEAGFHRPEKVNLGPIVFTLPTLSLSYVVHPDHAYSYTSEY